jgi:hypothetical protein
MGDVSFRFNQSSGGLREEMDEGEEANECRVELVGVQVE